VLANDFGTGQVFWSMLMFFFFLIWIWLLIVVFSDIFRSHDMGGWGKALWVIGIILFPYLGILVYLIARGGSMHERAVQQARQYDQAAQQYIRNAAGSASPTAELEKLNTLKSQGVIDQAEFDKLKAKIVAGAGAST
jgi:ABC-type multidrug transport system fused ATPase/permease subunit